MGQDKLKETVYKWKRAKVGKYEREAAIGREDENREKIICS